MMGNRLCKLKFHITNEIRKNLHEVAWLTVKKIIFYRGVHENDMKYGKNIFISIDRIVINTFSGLKIKG